MSRYNYSYRCECVVCKIIYTDLENIQIPVPSPVRLPPSHLKLAEQLEEKFPPADSGEVSILSELSEFDLCSSECAVIISLNVRFVYSDCALLRNCSRMVC